MKVSLRRPRGAPLPAATKTHTPPAPPPNNKKKNTTTPPPHTPHTAQPPRRPPQPLRMQPGDHRCPVAEIRDARKEKISGAGKKIERDADQQKKAQPHRCAGRIPQCKPKNRRSGQIRQRSARGDQP